MTLLPGVKDHSTYGFRWARDVDADLTTLREAGVTALVCLLEDHEFSRYGVTDLVHKANAAGLEVLRLPIPDTGIPQDIQGVDQLLDAVKAHEAKGGRLVIHCRGGLGRTGTIAGCYLVRQGESPAAAIGTLHRVRKTDRCPENATQEAFIARYAEHLRGTRSRRESPSTQRHTHSTGWYATALAGLGAAPRAAASKSDVARTLGDIEQAVAASPDGSFSFDERGEATLTAGGRSFAAGRFDTPSLGELRRGVSARTRRAPGTLGLSVLCGAHPLTDIGTLQGSAPPGTLFQVASQFNCLEAPGARVVPVHAYVHDNTQGPRASVSAFPGTLLRHYRAPAPDGTRFVQSDERCLNLLADAVAPHIAEIRSGYLQASGVRDMPALAESLEARFDHIRVGVHAGVEVVWGHDWSGAVSRPAPIISQVFTSTLALGGYSRDDGSSALSSARRQLLRAAYLGTLLAALDLECHTVVLTLIGGGVFGNPHRDIWNAIHWAIAEAEPLASSDVQVIVNTREPVAEVDREAIRARGGAVVLFGRAKLEASQ